MTCKWPGIFNTLLEFHTVNSNKIKKRKKTKTSGVEIISNIEHNY